MVSRNTDIPNNTNDSFQTSEKPSPFIITSFTIRKYHFDGTILETICSGSGMLSIGNINPPSNKVGNNNAIREIIWASCWVFVKLLIIRPSETAVMMNNKDSAISKNKLPLIGTSRMVTLTTKIVITFTRDKTIYGIALLMTNSKRIQWRYQNHFHGIDLFFPHDGNRCHHGGNQYQDHGHYTGHKIISTL